MKDMMEEKIFFGNDNIRLEGLYADADSSTGVVISHPHPLMGGDMRNHVVETVTETLQRRGMATLRFNFRGVGGSMGVYDGGLGEKDDVLAAVSFLGDKGKKDIILAGYSFGAWVNSGVMADRSFLPAVFISPPVSLLNFETTSLTGKVGLIVSGDSDQYCPKEKVKDFADRLICRLDLIANADHFYTGKRKELANSIQAFFTLSE